MKLCKQNLKKYGFSKVKIIFQSQKNQNFFHPEETCSTRRKDGGGRCGRGSYTLCIMRVRGAKTAAQDRKAAAGIPSREQQVGQHMARAVKGRSGRGKKACLARRAGLSSISLGRTWQTAPGCRGILGQCEGAFGWGRLHAWGQVGSCAMGAKYSAR